MAHVPTEGVSVAADFSKYPANVGTEREFMEGLESQNYIGHLAWEARQIAEGGAVSVGGKWYPLMSGERMFFVHEYLTRIVKLCRVMESGKDD